MRFNTLVAAAVSFSCALVASAVKQHPTPYIYLASKTIIQQANVTITAGAGGLVFNPSNVTANVGDQVVFSFINTHVSLSALLRDLPSHASDAPCRFQTVTQSSFGTPCTKLASGGFDSGP